MSEVNQGDVVKNAIAMMYRGEMSKGAAEAMISKQCSQQFLAEFIVDAFNRGWISRWNLGIDEDGNVV